ncbi:hypothetical protein WT63_27080 [Burkholderia anthina]|nr:hypothetical protein WT63_27080 [Burkholderia anthina]
MLDSRLGSSQSIFFILRIRASKNRHGFPGALYDFSRNENSMQSLPLGFKCERIFPYWLRVGVLGDGYMDFNFVVCSRLQAPQLRQTASILDCLLQSAAGGFADITKETKNIEKI